MKVVQEVKNDDAKYMIERTVGVQESQQSKPKTTVRKIGQMNGLADFESLIINKLAEITALWNTSQSPGDPRIVLRDILMNYFLYLQASQWKEWQVNVTTDMPNLHWQLYTYLESSWVHLTEFALNFTNINVITHNKPLIELETSSLV